MSQKSLLTTYLLWFFGGFLGLHHFYLGRDRHGILHLLFLNGYFGLGWIRDIWRIPEYVRDANEEKSYMKGLIEQMRQNNKPPNRYIRNLASMIVSDAFGYLTLAAIPSELIPEEYLPVAAFFVPFATAIGTYTVGNIGREEGSFKYCLVASYVTYPLYFWVSNPVFFTSLVVTFVFENYCKQWRRTPKQKHSFCYRLSIVILALVVYLSLWSSMLYFTCEFQSDDNVPVKCRDAAQHFFKSPMWNEFLTVIEEIWQFAQYHGWKEVWKHFIDALDPQGEAHALKVLQLNDSATEQEITSQYRKLARLWHPDKHRDPVQKEKAQEKFIEIQSAYGILTKSQRTTRNNS